MDTENLLLNKTIQEVFRAKPRPGRFLKIDELKQPILWKNAVPFTKLIVDENLNNEQKPQKEPSSLPKEYRIRKALSTAPWSYLEANESEECSEPSSLEKFLEILSIVISTVMLMAADYNDIPKNYLEWLYSYLYLIRDEYGHTPPNIQGIINHIRNITGDNIDSIIKDKSTVPSTSQEQAADTSPVSNTPQEPATDTSAVSESPQEQAAASSVVPSASPEVTDEQKTIRTSIVVKPSNN